LGVHARCIATFLTESLIELTLPRLSLPLCNINPGGSGLAQSAPELRTQFSAR
jgi:hypothetical protein